MGKASKNVNKFLREKNKISKEQIAYDRKVTRLRNETIIKNLQRDIDFKMSQADSGEIIETRVVSHAPDGTPVIIDGYKDGVKPVHILLNEIDELKARQEISRETLINLTKSEEQDAKLADTESTD